MTTPLKQIDLSSHKYIPIVETYGLMRKILPQKVGLYKTNTFHLTNNIESCEIDTVDADVNQFTDFSCLKHVNKIILRNSEGIREGYTSDVVLPSHVPILEIHGKGIYIKNKKDVIIDEFIQY